MRFAVGAFLVLIAFCLLTAWEQNIGDHDPPIREVEIKFLRDENGKLWFQFPQETATHLIKFDSVTSVISYDDGWAEVQAGGRIHRARIKAEIFMTLFEEVEK